MSPDPPSTRPQPIPVQGQLRVLAKAGWLISLHSTWCWSCEQHSRLHRRDTTNTDNWYCETCEVVWQTPALVYVVNASKSVVFTTIEVLRGKIRLTVNMDLQQNPGHGHAWSYLGKLTFGDLDEPPIRACGRCGLVEPMLGP